MIVQSQIYRSAMNYSNIGILSYDDEQALEDSVPDELAETLDLDMSGLSDAMMDDLREMVIY